MKSIDVICAGATIVDVLLQPVSKNIFNVESYPLKNVEMTIGGDAINEATVISRLGKKVALMSVIGNDPAGKFIVDSCKENNIEISSLIINPAITTSINVGLVTADGERTFVTNRNGSLWKMCAEDIDISRFSEAKILSLASIFNVPLLTGEKLERIFKAAKKSGMLICADMIMPRLGEKLSDIKGALSYIDYFFPNYEEAASITGLRDLEEIADVFLNCGVRNIIVKTGKQGCYIKNEFGGEMISAVKGIKAIDTTGAGDNFASGFITGLLEGRTLKECGALANATAAVSVQKLGATTGVQNREQVDLMYTRYLQQ